MFSDVTIKKKHKNTQTYRSCSQVIDEQKIYRNIDSIQTNSSKINNSEEAEFFNHSSLSDSVSKTIVRLLYDQSRHIFFMGSHSFI